MAEIVVTIMIMAIIAGVTLRITKARTDMISSYLYYGAYENLRIVVSEIIANNTANQSSLPASNICNEFKSFVNLSNKLDKSDVCKDSNPSVTAGTADFSGLTPDMVWNNGTKVYNLRNTPPPQIAELNNVPGYTIYIDIDGDKNNSVLNEDVFQFYLPETGQVVPVFDSSMDEAAQRHYLETSVQYDTYNAQGRVINWLVKSTSYKNAACQAGVIQGTYCGSITKNTAKCTDEADCRLMFVKPLGSR
jgi:hypothetical protein